MILLLIFMFQGVLHAADEPKCLPDDKFKFQSVDFKLNLDGNAKPDAVVTFAAGEGDNACERKAVVFDAPEKIEKAGEWLMKADFVSPELKLINYTVEKRAVGDRDLLYVEEQFGDYASFAYLSAEGGKMKQAMFHAHKNADGQFAEKYDSKAQALNVKVFDSGEFSVNGEAIDLDQRSIKNRCRVRELHVEIKYKWDRKDHKFKETDQGCVMGLAIE